MLSWIPGWAGLLCWLKASITLGVFATGGGGVGARGSLATFRGGSGGALEVLGTTGWVGGGLPLRTAPYVSFCKMLGTKDLCLSLARLVASLAKDAALDCSWPEPSW